MKQEGGVRNQLRAVRARLGLSQQDLAQAAGVTRQTIGGIEGGLYAPSAAVALKLARALGCRVEELFWLDEDAQPLTAVGVGALADTGDSRVTLARIGTRWVAHSLTGEQAVREEMIPCDGVAGPLLPGGSVHVRPLDDPETLARTVVLAGCTPAMSLWTRAAERWYPGLRAHWVFANSMQALGAVSRGEVHIAGLHLTDPLSGECNTPYVRRELGDRSVVLVNLGCWEEGLVVRAGNPRALRSAADLIQPGLALVNREPGAGSRLLLEQFLAAAGIPPSEVEGFATEVPGHWEVARAVASGAADVGVSTATVAFTYGLGFVPLREVRYDLAVPRAYLELEPVRQLLSTLDHRWVRSQLQVLGGYGTARSGEVVASVEPGSAPA